MNGGKCAPCADSDCLACDNSALNLCKLCRVNFTNFIVSYDNTTLDAEASECVCQEPFELDANDNCACPAGTTLDAPGKSGKCKKCSVNQCSNCESKDKKCAACFAPFVLNDKGDSCNCPEATVLYNGVCTPCSIDNCVSCSNPTVDTCNLCRVNFTLKADELIKDNSTSNVTIQTATCTCDAPFVLNIDGSCTCPAGLMLTSDGRCLSCMVQDC